MNSDNDLTPDLTPEAAVAEADRAVWQVRHRARWPGWMFLVFAVIDFAFFVIVGSGNRTASDALIPVPALLAAAIFLIAARQPVVGQDAQRINKPIAIAGLATAVAGLIIYQTVLPQHFTGRLLLLAALMVSPYFVGAWRWFSITDAGRAAFTSYLSALRDIVGEVR